MMRLWVVAALGAASWMDTGSPAHAAVSGCAQSEARLGAEVRAARAALMRIPVGDMDEAVPPAASAAIETVKNRIVAFVTGTMRCVAPNASAADVRRLLASRGDAFVDPSHYSADNYPNLHGDGLAYEVARPAGHPGLLAVMARLQIECGDDGVFMLFEHARGGSGWRLLILRRSPPYQGIEGAYGDFQFAVSPPDGQGRWYLATSHVPPWCTSAWRSLDYDLSRPGPAPELPHIFFSRNVRNYLGNDRGGAIRAEPNLFQVRHDGSIANTDILIRPHLATYAVLGDSVRRIQPAAPNARDFADEWVDTDWSEAGAWSGADPTIREAHRQLHAQGQNSYAPLGPARRCRGGLLQVRFGEGGAIWYLFVGGRGPFRLMHASRTQMPSCDGPDLNGNVIYLP
ncbi:MAG: hypothetical protein JO276_15690 [Sphingomonadaceae bacterium]|nr:hypothetical protein [Sphingomonadaceae bacterium]